MHCTHMLTFILAVFYVTCVCVFPFPRAHVCHGMCRERMHLLGGLPRSVGAAGPCGREWPGSASESDPGPPAGVSPEGVHLGGVGGGGPVRAAADSQPLPPSFPDALGFCLSVSLSLKLRLQEEQRTKGGGGTENPPEAPRACGSNAPRPGHSPILPAAACPRAGPAPPQVSGHSWTPVTSSP